MFKIHCGSEVKVLAVYNGSSTYGPWQSAKLDSEDGKTRHTCFIDPPIQSLHEGDIIHVDDIEFQVAWSSKDQARKESIRLKCHLVNTGAGFGGAYSTGEFTGNNFDPNAGELPF